MKPGHEAFIKAGLQSGLCYIDGDLHRILTPSIFYEQGPTSKWFKQFIEAVLAEAARLD